MVFEFSGKQNILFSSKFLLDMIIYIFLFPECLYIINLARYVLSSLKISLCHPASMGGGGKLASKK